MIGSRYCVIAACVILTMLSSRLRLVQTGAMRMLILNGDFSFDATVSQVGEPSQVESRRRSESR
jgi:hypothetical protein